MNLKTIKSLRLCVILCAVTVGGCAQSKVTTVVNSDGSWKRTIKFVSPKPGANGATANRKIDELFVLPSGALWKTTKGGDDEEVFYTAERQLQPNETQRRDLVVNNLKKVPLLVNEATVREIAPGKWEYREVLRWLGTPLEDSSLWKNPELQREIKKALPRKLASEADARAIAHTVGREAMKILFGPPEPLFFYLVTNPDLAEQEIEQRLGVAITRGLQARFGDRLTAEERLAIARKWSSLTKVIRENGKDAIGSDSGFGGKGSPQKGKEKNKRETEQNEIKQLVAMTFVLKMPGKIVSTNGKINHITNEVYWGLHLPAVMTGDVVLTATYLSADTPKIETGQSKTKKTKGNGSSSESDGNHTPNPRHDPRSLILAGLLGAVIGIISCRFIGRLTSKPKR